MRIGIDGRVLHWPAGRTGAARYLSELLAFFEKKGEHEFFIYGSAPIPEARGWPPHFHFRQLAFPIRSNIVWENTVLPLDIQKSRLDVFFSPFFTMPYLATCKTVVAILDLFFEVGPQWFPWRRRVYFKVLSRLSVRRSSAILSISQATQADLVQRYQVPEKKIFTIPLGVSSTLSSFHCVADDELERIRPYVLYVGAIHQRKNLERLIESFALVKREPAGQKHKLVVAGKFEHSLGASEKLLRELVQSLQLETDVIFTGYVDDVKLAHLYASADLLAFPSLYEGFGLPILEAMDYGVPVVTSNVSSMPEVAGDAALLVNPYDVKDIAQAMLAILSNRALRDELVRKGIERVKEFSWERTASQTLRVLERVGES